MFSEQKTFKHRDKPNTYLAKLLSGKQGGSPVPSYMISKEGIVVDAIRGKLHVCLLL